MKVSAEHDDWGKIVYCGLENQQIDFKAPQNWNTIGRAGRAKFARHAIALANTSGGYVVIGVGEDENGNPKKYDGMSVEEASSFDPSAVGQTLASYADPPISLDVVRPVLDGKQYVVLVIYPFREMPHVCSNTCEHELQSGVFYVRTPDARSKAATKASELHLLINRALRNQRQMLGRMLRGILYEDRQTEYPEQDVMRSLVQRSRQRAVEKAGKNAMQRDPYFEVICMPQEMFDDISLTDLRSAIDALDRPAIRELPWDCADCSVESFATNDSICGLRTGDGKVSAIWEMYQNGLFYAAAIFPDGQSSRHAIQSESLAHAVMSSMSVIGQLFTLINHPDALLDITVRMPNTDGVKLEGISSVPLVSRIMDIEVSKERTAGDLEGGAASDTSARIFAEICERFNASFDKAALAELKLKFSRFF